MNNTIKVFSFVYKHKEYELLYSKEYDKYYTNLRRNNHMITYIDNDYQYSMSFLKYLIENEGY